MEAFPPRKSASNQTGISIPDSARALHRSLDIAPDAPPGVCALGINNMSLECQRWTAADRGCTGSVVALPSDEGEAPG